MWTLATLWGLVHFRRHPVPSALVAIGFGVFLFRQLLWIAPQAWILAYGDPDLYRSPGFVALGPVRVVLGVVQIVLVGAAGLVGRVAPTAEDR